MAQVLLGQSYYLRFDPKLWDAMQPYPPLGTLYAAGYLRQQGFSVALFDAMLAQSITEWADALERHQPRFAVIYEDGFNYLSKMCLLKMRQASFEMMDIAKRVCPTVIVSGSDATDHVEEYRNHGADYVLLGEAEITLAELVAHLESRGPQGAEDIPGVAVGGGPPKAGARPLLRELDTLPFPAWDLVDIPRYRSIWRARHGYYSINMATTRGCPYECNWCAKPIYGRHYHARTPENVVDEMELLRRIAEPDHFWFADDIFGLKPGWIRSFAQLVSERRVRTPFKCLMRPDLVTPEVARELGKAGCRTVWMGAESGSQKILDAMEKRARVDDTRHATRLLRNEGIEVCYFLQFGYPGENWQDVLKTIQLVRDCLPDDIGVSVSYPLPGTRFYENVRSQLESKQNWLDSDDLAMLYRGPFSQDFYRHLHSTLHREYRARKAWAQIRAGGNLRHLVAIFRAARLPLDRLKLAWLRTRAS